MRGTLPDLFLSLRQLKVQVRNCSALFHLLFASLSFLLFLLLILRRDIPGVNRKRALCDNLP